MVLMGGQTTTGSVCRQAAASRRLGWTENAVRVAVHRLRKRFRDLVRAEDSQTVDEPAQFQDELRDLLEVVSQ